MCMTFDFDLDPISVTDLGSDTQLAFPSLRGVGERKARSVYRVLPPFCGSLVYINLCIHRIKI